MLVLYFPNSLLGGTKLLYFLTYFDYRKVFIRHQKFSSNQSYNKVAYYRYKTASALIYYADDSFKRSRVCNIQFFIHSTVYLTTWTSIIVITYLKIAIAYYIEKFRSPTLENKTQKYCMRAVLLQNNHQDAISLLKWNVKRTSICYNIKYCCCTTNIQFRH